MKKMTYKVVEEEDPRSMYDGTAMVLYLRGTGEGGGVSRICPTDEWTSAVEQSWRAEMAMYGYTEE